MNESNALCSWKAHGWASGLIQYLSQVVESSWLLFTLPSGMSASHASRLFSWLSLWHQQKLELDAALVLLRLRIGLLFLKHFYFLQALNKIPKFWVICPPLSYMWKLDHKEGWASKNWCFWAVVLENTLESLLVYKETQSVHLKGNESWVFIGRTDAKPETPRLWPSDAKSQLIGKDPDAGKDWLQEEKGTREDEMVGWHHWLKRTWVWANSGRWWRTGKPTVLQSMGSLWDPDRTLGHSESLCHSDRTEWLNNNMAITESKVWPDDKTDFRAVSTALKCRWVDSILNWWLLHSEHKRWGINANTYYGMQIYMYTYRYIYAQM